MIRLVLVGGYGRMGTAIAEAARAAGGFEIKSRIGRPGKSGPRADATGYVEDENAGPVPGSGEGGDLGQAVAAGDVVVEFSGPDGFRAAARACADRGAALVSGTTGLDPADEALLEAVATRAPVLRAANFSLGLLAVRQALGAALAALPGRWDIEIVERHHRNKADSPSGTALALARDAAQARGLGEDALRFGRSGRVGARPEREIGVHAVRGGTWVGDHAVLLAGDGEWVEIRHVVENRAAFAHGVLEAARFVNTARPGFYKLEDVLQGRAR